MCFGMVVYALLSERLMFLQHAFLRSVFASLSFSFLTLQCFGRFLVTAHISNAEGELCFAFTWGALLMQSQS